MDILEIKEGKSTEKTGTLLQETEQQTKKTDSEMLEQIDEKLDTLIAAQAASDRKSVV